MNKVDKFLKKLSLEDRIVVEKCLNLVKSGNFANLDFKKLKGKENKFRVRKGNIRIIFSIENTVKILSIGRRDDTTYDL